MSDLWIYRRCRSAPRLRLFCFPYAGGSAATYSRWQEEFPDEIEVCAVELPGRRTRLREPVIRQPDELLDAVADGLRPYFDLPFAFFGHSMGALLSFEIARELRRQRRPGPRALFISGVKAPQLPRRARALWDLPEADFVREIHRYGGIPQVVLDEPEVLKLFLPVLRADFEIFDTYRYRPEESLNVPVHRYGGIDDEHVRPDDIAAWAELTTGRTSLRIFPGGHFYLNDQRQSLVAAIAVELAGLLDAVPTDTSDGEDQQAV